MDPSRKFIGAPPPASEPTRVGFPLRLVLYGKCRGKFVMLIAHAYCMAELKLGLTPTTHNAPWRVGKGQDYFAWRKMVVEERNEIRQTICELLGFELPSPHLPKWPMLKGATVYDGELAGHVSHEFARTILDLTGLGQKPFAGDAADPARLD